MIRRIFTKLKNLIMTRSAYRFFIKDWTRLGDLDRCADAVATMRYSTNLESVVLEHPAAERILVIAPHPDDEMLGPGGTLLKAIAAGSRVRVLYLTQGRPAQAATVVAEATAAAKCAGYEQYFLDYFSRELPLDTDCLSRIRSEIETFQPEVLMLPFFCDDHDDHRRASHLLWLLHQERALPSKIQVWAYQVYTALIPNVVVDISEFAERKRELIHLWVSQAKSRDWGHFALGLNAFNSRFLSTTTMPCYAEAFFVLPVADYCDLSGGYFEGKGTCYYSENYCND